MGFLIFDGEIEPSLYVNSSRITNSALIGLRFRRLESTELFIFLLLTMLVVQDRSLFFEINEKK